MYNREYKGKKINFEASGGLMHASLVLQDKETDSYWSIMTGMSIAGEFKGTKLDELPIGEKMQWRDWLKKHPGTRVLSVKGKEDSRDSYRDYFASKNGFRGITARDSRLQTKESIFAFHYNNQSYALAHKDLVGGKILNLGDIVVLLYRAEGAARFKSTSAYQTTRGFEIKDGLWVDSESGCTFNPESAKFEDINSCPEKFEGFDTFWYNWSLNNPETKLLQ